MTEQEFLTLMRQIGLDTQDHDIEELHAAYLRLVSLFDRLDTKSPRAEAKALPVFDPRSVL